MFTQELVSRLNQIHNLVQNAEQDLGPLTFGQRSDLLLDNFEWILDSVESKELLKIAGLSTCVLSNNL